MVTTMRSFPDLCVADVVASAEFYCTLLDLDVLVNHGWYAELGREGDTLLALVEVGHETVPDPASRSDCASVTNWASAT